MTLSAKGKDFQTALPALREAWAQGHFEAYVVIFATQRGLQLAGISLSGPNGSKRSNMGEEWERERGMGAAVWIVPKGTFAAIASIGSRFDFFSDDECRKATHAALGPSGMWLSGSAAQAIRSTRLTRTRGDSPCTSQPALSTPTALAI